MTKSSSPCSGRHVTKGLSRSGRELKDLRDLEVRHVAIAVAVSPRPPSRPFEPHSAPQRPGRCSVTARNFPSRAARPGSRRSGSVSARNGVLPRDRCAHASPLRARRTRARTACSHALASRPNAQIIFHCTPRLHFSPVAHPRGAGNMKAQSRKRPRPAVHSPIVPSGVAIGHEVRQLMNNFALKQLDDMGTLPTTDEMNAHFDRSLSLTQRF